MASTDCGWCGRLVHLDAVSPLFTVPTDVDKLVTEAAYKCPNCHRLIIIWEYAGAYRGTGDISAAQARLWVDPSFIPGHRDSKPFPGVPEHIGRAATEATLCFSAGAYRAVGSLARAVIEATAKDKGAEGRDLYQRIEALAEAEHIRKHTRDQAHEVRHFGNGMAHGDFTEPVTKEDAEEIIALMTEVLGEVYQSPARLQRIQQARVARTTEA